MSTLTCAAVTIRKAIAEDWPLLARMYEGFPSSAESLGLPPQDEVRRLQWLERFWKEGVNLVAVVDESIVGHLVLMPSEVVAEMAVFVREDHRRQGVGQSLAVAAIEEARKRGLRSVWVLISSSNGGAWKGLHKFGFRTAWESQGEVQLVFPL